MFDIAWSEFLIVAVVALVVVGPRDLPGLLRNVGRMIGTVRRMAGEFQTQFNDALREAELDELKREVTGLRDSASKFVGGSDPFSIARDEIKKAVDGKKADAPSALAGPPPEVDVAADTPSAFAPPAIETPPGSGGDEPAADPQVGPALNGAAPHDAPKVPDDQPRPTAGAAS